MGASVLQAAGRLLSKCDLVPLATKTDDTLIFSAGRTQSPPLALIFSLAIHPSKRLILVRACAHLWWSVNEQRREKIETCRAHEMRIWGRALASLLALWLYILQNIIWQYLLAGYTKNHFVWLEKMQGKKELIEKIKNSSVFSIFKCRFYSKKKV